ncbi:hypothetical protein LSH36_239g04019 [Paralvinella palmiformis]|uniref:G-protein coupled receptors family 1 profile domain-containing protein n=1 Tax=Paralvinella palmiformis TaxID=53620 RepID=A0AAD9JN18_9ANNE|nr:hypothetical protein LSH36_239g04019 [Paralvinella palmiformis]
MSDGGATNLTQLRLLLERLTPSQVDELLNQLHLNHPELADASEPNRMHIRSYEQQLMRYEPYRIQKLLLLYIPPILIILGTFGNVFSFVILKRKAMLKFSTYYYLMVLAVADTLVLYVGLLRLWIGELTGFDVRDRADWLCKLTNVVGYTVSDFSVWLIIAVTVERYIVVCHPLRASTMCNARRARKVIGGLLCGLLLLNAHFLWTVRIVYFKHAGDTIPQCAGSRRHSRLVEQVWPWLDTVVYSVLPFLIIIVLNALIVRQVIRARRHRIQLRNGSMYEQAQRRPSHEGSTRLTVMLLTITFAFLLTTLPMTVANILAAFWNEYRTDLAAVSRFKLGRTITELLMYVNHSMNFFLYCATGQKFRHQLVWMVCYARRPYSLNLITLSEPTTQPSRFDSVRNNGKSGPSLRRPDLGSELYPCMVKSDMYSSLMAAKRHTPPEMTETPLTEIK